MCQFFRGWIRKSGVAALLLACLMIGLWMRSCTVTDRIDCHSGWLRLTQSMVSSSGSLSRERQDELRLPVWKRGAAGQTRQARRALSPISLRSELVVADGSLVPRLDAPDIHWNWRWCGFGTGSWSSQRTTFWVIPCWSVAVALITLSAFLLLAKLHKSTSNKLPEPNPNGGA